MEKEIICIVCPKGCKISARLDSENDVAGAACGKEPDEAGNAKRAADGNSPAVQYEVSGHGCTRGYEYAISECTNPVRTLTTTVRLLCEDAGGACNAYEARVTERTGSINRTGPALVPVKSSSPLPKGLLKNCMKIVNSAAARPPVRIGDIIVPDILGTGIDIIATANVTGEECKWRRGT